MKSLVQINKKLREIVIQASCLYVIRLRIKRNKSQYRRDACTTVISVLILFIFLVIGDVKAQEVDRLSKIKFNYKGKLQEYFPDIDDTFPIDLKAIYYSIFADPVFQDSIYDYLRFFPEGQIFRSGNYQHEPSPTEAQQENLRQGYHGYYYIKDTLLHMEIYTDRYSDKEYFVATINDSSINLCKAKTMRAPDILAATRKDTIIYHKKPVPFSDDVTPHW